jgi:hypothetical protein
MYDYRDCARLRWAGLYSTRQRSLTAGDAFLLKEYRTPRIKEKVILPVGLSERMEDLQHDRLSRRPSGRKQIRSLGLRPFSRGSNLLRRGSK